MRAAICDDDEKIGSKLRMFLEDYGEMRGISVEVEVFSDGEFLLKELEMGKRYDILFLDIIMKNVNGIKAGHFVRETLGDFQTRIIYMSVCEDHLMELFDKQPVGFWKKPLNLEKMVSDMDQLMRQMAGDSFFYRSGRVANQIPYREILYYESVGRKVLVHTRREVHQYFGKLSQLLEHGLPPNFLCIHKSYIVNLDHVREIRSDCVYLPDGDRWLSISKTHRKRVGLMVRKAEFDTKTAYL